MLRHKWAISVLASVALVCPVAGQAQMVAPAVLQWHCLQEFDDQYHVRCVPDRPDREGFTGQALARDEWSAPSRSVRDLRPVAQRGDGEIFAVRAWQVPLYAFPIDAAFVVELLSATLCGRVSACTVSYALSEVRSAGVIRAAAQGRTIKPTAPPNVGR